MFNDLKEGAGFYIKSRPVPVHLAGFTSDTLTLQRQGWNLAVEQYHSPWNAGTSLRLVIKHSVGKLCGISRETQLRIDTFNSPPSRWFDELRFEMTGLYSDIIFRQETAPSFQAFDARPEFTPIAMQQFSLMELNPFKTISDSQELIIDPNDVPDLMEKILNAQAPKQAEIRERLRKEKAREEHNFNSRPATKIHGTILSLVG